MGVPSAALVQNLTDGVAALIAKDLAGYESEYSGKTNVSLWDYVDGSGDADVETALGAVSLGLDAMSLPENASGYLPQLLGRTAFKSWLSALNTLVTGAAGGYASLRAYLADKSATVHPLFGELVRNVLGPAALTDSDGDVTTCFAPSYSTRAPDRVWVGADGALSEETVDAGDVGTADITLFGSNNHYLYVGSRYKFSQLIAALSTLASASITPLFQYWNGSSWATLTVTDNSSGFQRNDVIKWTSPADWSRAYLDGSSAVFSASAKERLYYIRIKRTNAAGITAPIGTCMRLVPAAVLTGTKHLGLPQPPLAIVRVSAVDTIVVDPIVAVDFSRFIEPAIRLRALTPFGADITPTVAYVDQDGNSASQAQSAWVAPAALDEVAVALAGGDTGARSIPSTGHAATIAAAQGVYEVCVTESRTPAI